MREPTLASRVMSGNMNAYAGREEIMPPLKIKSSLQQALTGNVCRLLSGPLYFILFII